MHEPLPQPFDEAILNAGRLEPRQAWGLDEGLHEWRKGRWLPSEEATLLQLECLGLWKGLKTFQPAAGTGWLSALLIRLGARLSASEPDSALLRDLSSRMPLDVPLCRARPADGWPQAAPFDRICPGEVLLAEPDVLLAQLAPEGRMVYWIVIPEGLELRLDILEGGGVVRESLALVRKECCPEELIALTRP